MSGGLKGYPSSQKLVKGQPPITEFATIQPTDLGLRGALDVVRFAFRVGSDSVPRTAQAGTGNPTNGQATEVFDTSTPARVGDFVRFETGLAARLEIPIVAVSTNSFTLGAKIPTSYAPAATDTFFIMRYATQRVDENGSQIVTVTQGPIQFVLDGLDREVEEDTGTPANSIPLPVKVLDGSGLETDFATEAKQDVQITEAQTANASLAVIEAVDFATQATLSSIDTKTPSLGQALMAASVPVVVASDQTPLPISASALPLPTGAATEAKQDDIITALGSANTSLDNIEADADTLAGTVKTDAGAVPATTAIAIGGNNSGGTDFNVLQVDAQGHAKIDVMTSALPTGAATEATLASVLADTTAIAGDTASLDSKFGTLGQKNMAGSAPVVFASDQTAIPVTPSIPVNTGIFDQITNLVATAQTFTAPANAIGFKIQTPSTNTENCAFSIGATATITAGILMEPGRSEDFDTGSNISVIATSAAAQTVNVIWKVKP